MNRISFPGTFILLFCSFITLAATPEFHRVTAQNGDGIYSLLRRYELDQHSCNFSKFYELNKIKRNTPLLTGKKYYIPVILYSYNGKSIRTTIGIESWQQAVKIQKYNERMLADKNRRMTFQKSKILWVRYNELNCGASIREEKEEKIEALEPKDIAEENEEPIAAPNVSNKVDLANSAGGARQFPIFGKKYAYTPLLSDALAGQVFYIVSGHGGPDPGAMTKRSGNQLCEDEYAYDVALRLCRMLVANGATAYMITRDPNDGIRDTKYLGCDYDEVLWGNVKMYRQHKPRLFQRSNIINEIYNKHKKQGVKKQKLIAIHIDSRNKSAQTDLFFYYFPTDKAGRSLAYQLHKTMRDKYKKHRASGYYSGTVSGRDLHMLRETLPPSVYIELGNIANAHDQQRIILKGNRDALAKWLFEGLTR